MYKKPQNKIFQGGPEQVQLDLSHGGYLIMSLKKHRQLNHYFLGVGSKDILEEITGRGRKEEKCRTGQGGCELVQRVRSGFRIKRS